MRDSSTLLHRLYLWAMDQPDQPAQHFRADRFHWKSISAQSFWLQVVRIAIYLKSFDFEKTTRVMIFAGNSPEWIQWELGVVLAGGQSIGIHPSISPVELNQILEQTQPQMVILESELYLNTLQSWKSKTPDGPTLILTFAQAAEQILARSSTDPALTHIQGERLLDSLSPDSAQFIVYTSGTTGTPKGVLLSLANLTRVADTLIREWNLPFVSGTLFSFLPLAHVAEKVQSISVALSLRYPVYFNSRYDRFLDELKEVQPTILLAVPRVWEKLKEGIEQRKPKLLHTLKEIDFMGPLAERIFLTQVKQRLGLERLQIAVSGAAKLPPQLGEWYRSIGIEIQEIYGMSETSGVITLTHPKRLDFNWVGRPAAGVELELSPEGEIWVKTPFQFLGYFGDERATLEIQPREGWIRTGDLGEWVESERGERELHLIGRNREIIKLSNGKMVAPVPIENALKSIPQISNVCVLGDDRPELIALITLKESMLLEVKFVPGAVEGLIVADEGIRAQIQGAIQKLNEEGVLPHPVKKWVILSRDFSLERGEITPTQKLNRRNIIKNFSHFVDLYFEETL